MNRELNSMTTMLSDYTHVHIACKQINAQLYLSLTQHLVTPKKDVRVNFVIP